MEYTIQEMDSMMKYLAILYQKDIFEDSSIFEIQEETSSYCRFEFHVLIHKTLAILREEERDMILQEYLSLKDSAWCEIREDESAYNEQKNKALRAFFRCLNSQKML